MFVGDNFTFSNAPALANRSRNEDRRIRVQLPVRLRAVFPIIYLDCGIAILGTYGRYKACTV
jgi:hypothetical protein